MHEQTNENIPPMKLANQYIIYLISRLAVRQN